MVALDDLKFKTFFPFYVFKLRCKNTLNLFVYVDDLRYSQQLFSRGGMLNCLLVLSTGYNYSVMSSCVLIRGQSALLKDTAECFR